MLILTANTGGMFRHVTVILSQLSLCLTASLRRNNIFTEKMLKFGHSTLILHAISITNDEHPTSISFP